MKKVLLVLAVATAFLVGYGSSAKAFHAPLCGYFYDNCRNNAGYVGSGDVWGPYSGAGAGLPPPASPDALPSHIDTKAEFINVMWNHLNYGPSPYQAQNRVGAAFMIHTMIGSPHPSGSTAVSGAEWNEFVDRVNYANVDWCADISSGTNTFFQYAYNDIAWYSSFVSDSCGVVFYDPLTGAELYKIRRNCANPIGALFPLRKPIDFDLGGRVDLDNPNPKPATTIKFTYYVNNNGPQDTAPTTVNGWAINSNTGAVVAGPINVGTIAPGGAGSPQEKRIYEENYPVPANAAPGTTICRHSRWNPDRPGGGDGTSAPRCAVVAYDFNLTPTAVVDNPNGAEGDTVRFTFRVTNAGLTPTTPVTCKVVGTTYAPGHTPLPQQDADRGSGPGYVPPPTSCPQVFQPGVPTDVATQDVPIGALAPGTQICRSLVINPKSDAGGFRASAEACVIIAKTPYAHFLGNDVFAGGNFQYVNPACNTRAKITTFGRTLSGGGGTAGSVGEYGVYALDRVIGFGSTSKVLSGSGSLGDVSRQWTFGNSELNAALLGYFGKPQHCIEDYTGQFSASPTIGPATINVGTRPSGAWHVTGALTVQGTLVAGSKQVYYADGDVTINGDIRYPATYTGKGQIPSLVVISKGNIYVQANVRQLDGVFVASGNGTTRGIFYTCWPKNEPASISNACNANQLVINGSVTASRLDLFRSYGATGGTPAARKEPGEVFNFSPELYLNNAINSQNNSTIQITNVLELPPRF